MRPRRRWTIGLLTGAMAGAGALLTGLVGGLLALVAIGLAVAEPPRAATIGGVLVGLGGAWIALFGRVALTCRDDCVGPDLRAWLLIAGTLTGLGILVTARAVSAG